MRILDFRSDTVTQPTEAMRLAMAQAIVGDDLLGDDPTVQELEAYGAALFGKEAALYVLSGTMANQIAIMTLTERGDEVLVGEKSHIYNLEVGGLAALSQVQVRPLTSDNMGQFSDDSIENAVRKPGIQAPKSRVLCLENTFNLNRGIALSSTYFQHIGQLAHKHQLYTYLDGARVFNAAVALNEDVNTIVSSIDALQVCLTKGLAAPMGSLLVGDDAFINKARWIRQRLGGGMRQAGHMAAAGLVALREMIGRLQEDHAHAQLLTNALLEINEALVDCHSHSTNIVLVDFSAVNRTAHQMVEALASYGIRIKPISKFKCRMVTHWGISEQDIKDTIKSIAKVCKL